MRFVQPITPDHGDHEVSVPPQLAPSDRLAIPDTGDVPVRYMTREVTIDGQVFVETLEPLIEADLFEPTGWVVVSREPKDGPP